MTAAPWRLAQSLVVLRDEINAAHPGRDKASDGTIGDARHQAEQQSDHNPNGAGVVRAFDVDAGPGLDPTGPDAAVAVELAERVRQLGHGGFPALQGGGYVIYNHRIASEVQDWEWRPYYGQDPHTSHAHISVGRAPSAYDSQLPWTLPVVQPPRPAQMPPSVQHPPAAVQPPTPKGLAVQTVDLRHASAAHPVTGPGVRALQALLILAGCLRGPVDGYGGVGTRAALVTFQTRKFGHADLIAGPVTFGALDEL